MRPEYGENENEASLCEAETETSSRHKPIFYARQLYRQVLLRARISYGNSVRFSACLSRPGTDSRPGEIETPGLHHMIAYSL